MAKFSGRSETAADGRRGNGHFRCFVALVIATGAAPGCSPTGPAGGEADSPAPAAGLATGRDEIRFRQRGSSLGLVDESLFGMSVADVDGDGFEDLLHGRHLYAVPLIAFNNGQGEFEVRDETLIGPLEDRDRHTGAWVDIDNDGDQDLYYPSGNEKPHEMWINQGGGLAFVDAWLGVEPQVLSGRGRSAVWFDWNNDGFLDVFMITVREDSHSKLGENLAGKGAFADRTQEAGLYHLPDSANSSNGGCGVADYDEDGDMDMLLCNGHGGIYAPGEEDGRTKLFRQSADGTFADVLDEALDSNARLWAMSARWGDFDNDGLLDVYVARGIARRDYGARRLGDGVTQISPDRLAFFSRVGDDDDAEDGFEVQLAGATRLMFDPRRFRSFIADADPEQTFLGPDGAQPAEFPVELDATNVSLWGEPAMEQAGVFLWLEDDGQTLVFRHHVPANSGVAYSSGYLKALDGAFDVPVARAMERTGSFADQLYRNRGDGTFENVTEQMGIDNDASSTVASWADFDNDGDLDILVLNHHYDVPANRPVVLYRNDGDGGFVDVADSAGLEPTLNSTIVSLAVADFDVNGSMDFAISYEIGPAPRASERPKYYVGAKGENHWLQVNLVGTRSNRNAIGAKAWLTTADGVQYRQQTGGYHIFGQDSMILHFGLGSQETADLALQWPSGARQTLSGIKADQRITVLEAEDIPGG